MLHSSGPDLAQSPPGTYGARHSGW